MLDINTEIHNAYEVIKNGGISLVGEFVHRFDDFVGFGRMKNPDDR